MIESREFAGVRRLPGFVPAKGEQIDLFTIECYLPNLADAQEWLNIQVGKKYDYGAVVRFITRQQEDRKGSGKFFCSELVFAFVRKAGLNLLERIEPWAVDPGRLSTSPYLNYESTIKN